MRPKPSADVSTARRVIRKLYERNQYADSTGQVDLKEDTKGQLAKMGLQIHPETLSRALDAEAYVEKNGLRRSGLGGRRSGSNAHDE